MFQIELLSGGIFTVYAVDSYANLFLIYKDDAWQWIEINRCKLYYAGALAKRRKRWEQFWRLTRGIWNQGMSS